jgi:hypothetical protein
MAELSANDKFHISQKTEFSLNGRVFVLIIVLHFISALNWNNIALLINNQLKHSALSGYDRGNNCKLPIYLPEVKEKKVSGA